MSHIFGTFERGSPAAVSMRGGETVSSPSGAHLEWDGRLDNAAELAGALSLQDPYCSDAAIVLAAYDRFGEGFLGRLIGDFTLALHDPRRGALLLARDPFGVRPLFYHATAGRVVWAGRIKRILAAARLPAEPDDEWIGNYLVHLPGLDRTPYRGVCMVRPGEALIFEKGVERRASFHRLGGAPLRHASDADDEAQFRELFLAGVQARTRAKGPVFAELSGGVDSSSVACAARHLIDSGAAGATSLDTVSFVFERSPTSDERAHIRVVEEKLGRPGHHIGEDNLTFRDLEAPSPETPAYLDCFPGLYSRIEEAMHGAGASVLLTGFGGDSVLWSEVSAPLEIADHIAGGNPRALLASLGTWHKIQHKPYAELLWEGGIRPLLPRSLQRRLAPARPVPPWIGASFTRRIGLTARRSDNGGESDLLPSRRAHHAYIRSDIEILAWQYCAHDGSCIEVAHPFLHRPLVEMCLSLPLDKLLRDGETRSLCRRALRGLVPERTLRRRDKRGPDEAFQRAIAGQWGTVEGLLEGSRGVARGYLDAAELRDALNQARFGNSPSILPVMRALSLEYWLRGLERPAAKRPEAALGAAL